MAKDDIGKKLKEAIEHFGSLQEAMTSTELKNKALEEENQQLEQKNGKLTSSIEKLNMKFEAEKKKVELIAAKVSKYERQYKLFEGFLDILLTSPSVSISLKSLIALLQELTDYGWALTATPDEVRDLFMSKVMGDYLKCFRCKICGNRFITNKGPEGGIYSKYYVCPSCHNSHQLEPDDSFLKAMVSEKQLDDITTAVELKEENDILKPLKAFLEVTCDVCGMPIIEWDNHNVKIARERALWGHTECWKSGPGQVLLLMKHMNYLKEGAPGS